MINVLIKTESHYTVNRPRIREAIEKILTQMRVRGNIEVSVNVVGDRLMKDLNSKYRGLPETTDVLSFPLSEEADIPFVDAPDGILHLGDIVISYPQARQDALVEEKLVDDKIDELVEHSLLHLLGQHHDE